MAIVLEQREAITSAGVLALSPHVYEALVNGELCAFIRTEDPPNIGPGIGIAYVGQDERDDDDAETYFSPIDIVVESVKTCLVTSLTEEDAEAAGWKNLRELHQALAGGPDPRRRMSIAWVVHLRVLHPALCPTHSMLDKESKISRKPAKRKMH